MNIGSMPPRGIDLRALEGRAACEEGVAWLRAQGGHLELDARVEALLDEEPGYAVWGFLHLPEVREALGDLRLTAMGGPRHARLAALFEELKATPLLTGSGDDRRVQRLTQAHLRALSPLAPDLKLADPVPITRVNLVDAWRLCPPAEEEGLPLPPPEWVAGWWSEREALAPAAPLPRERATAAAAARAQIRRWLWAQVGPIRPVAEWIGRFIGAAAFRAAFRGARAALGPGASERWITCRAAATAARLDAVDEALWALAAVEAPSPFEPLLSLWRHGVWPAGLSNGVFIIGVAEDDRA